MTDLSQHGGEELDRARAVIWGAYEAIQSGHDDDAEALLEAYVAESHPLPAPKNDEERIFMTKKKSVPKWEKVADEVRLRLYSLLNAHERSHPPLREDIDWFAAYCELDVQPLPAPVEPVQTFEASDEEVAWKGTFEELKQARYLLWAELINEDDTKMKPGTADIVDDVIGILDAYIASRQVAAPVEEGQPEDLLDKMALALMTVELNKHMRKTLDEALRIPSEIQRTYKRLLASGEAQTMLSELQKAGLKVSVSSPTEKAGREIS